MLAAIFRKSTLLVHYNLQILLIIRIIMDVYRNFPDLPHNCIFNKGITGCGGTTIALFNDEPYIVAVPTTELIINKTGLDSAGAATITSPDGKEQTVFGLFGIFSYQVKKQLKEYLSGSGVKKILCTYDKVAKLSEYL